ncbi:ABC transporter ATP-binding protein [Clostridium thailandense]|uniref:ABC transporter ATP-binding protein n=1 Tax=Clostridium thailandense TaxID=2794346 RepID=UPI0039899E7A
MNEMPFFELQGVSKYFAKVIANKDVSFSINRGEVLALLGENGAGKSTIMKILYGLYKPDEGLILKDGKEVKINSPRDAMSLGISMIQQHFSLVPAHTVTENIILGNVHGKIDYKKCKEEVKKLAETYDFDIPVDEIICNLDVGTQQKVEILKALYLNTSVLIMDEPTAVLTPQESGKLMDFVLQFTAKGNSIIFITHKMKEVMAVADRIIVMRNGEVCGDLQRKDTSETALSRLMMGKDIIEPKKAAWSIVNQETLLMVKNVTVKNNEETMVLNNLSFDIYKGEILGVAGVSGNGQDELCEVVCGSQTVSEGTIFMDDDDITSTSVEERISLGIGYVPADRHRDAMVGNMSIAENMMLRTSYDRKWLKHGFIDRKKLNKYTDDIINIYNVKAPGPDTRLGGLSGGNQQKVILGREVDNGKKLLILNQPTRGLDLGAINNIHTTILEEKKNGKSVLLISTELSEIFSLCDRVAVMFKGKFMGIYKEGELTTEKIGLLMAGYSAESEMNKV